jgi:hypothetical protein
MIVSEKTEKLYASSEKLRSEPLRLAAWQQALEMSCRGDSADSVCKHLAYVKEELQELSILWSDICKSFWRPKLGYTQRNARQDDDKKEK